MGRILHRRWLDQGLGNRFARSPPRRFPDPQWPPPVFSEIVLDREGDVVGLPLEVVFFEMSCRMNGMRRFKLEFCSISPKGDGTGAEGLSLQSATFRVPYTTAHNLSEELYHMCPALVGV